MTTYYLDTDFRAHVEQNEAGTLTAWEDETGFFDGKCQTFVEGYRVVPEGETWVREDGETFRGLMIAPYKSFATLKAAQTEYEKMKAELDTANSIVNELIGGVEDVQQE